jgi:hypothetical protein
MGFTVNSIWLKNHKYVGAGCRACLEGKMKQFVFGAFAATALAIAAPAAAVTQLTFSFGGGTGAGSNLQSLAVTNTGVTLTATAHLFTALPDSLTDLSQTTAMGTLTWSVPGIGVAGGGNSFGIDTNLPNVREAVLVTGSRNFSLAGLTLSRVDNDDTLQVYGVNGDGSLVNLGYPGIIRRQLNGPNASLSLLAGEATGPAFEASLNGGTQSLTLVNPTSFFNSYLFTTRQAGDESYLGTTGQGYRLDSLVVGVPEPESWALLIVGFGLVGVAARRRRTAVSA